MPPSGISKRRAAAKTDASGRFRIDFLPPGRYSVTLKFAESWFGPGKPGGGGACPCM
jgi:hypothetical protein